GRKPNCRPSSGAHEPTRCWTTRAVRRKRQRKWRRWCKNGAKRWISRAENQAAVVFSSEEAGLNIIGFFCLPPARAATCTIADIRVLSHSLSKLRCERQNRHEHARGSLPWRGSGRPFCRRPQQGEL